MKTTIKSKISHLFKGKPSKLDKYPTNDQPCNVEDENEKHVHVHNKKTHKKPKTELTLLETHRKNLQEFPVLPSPMNDQNESSKLTAQEFAKAVGIKILHRTDEEEDEDCDCEYCRASTQRSNLNTVTTIDSTYVDDNVTPTYQIPNVTANQYSVSSIPSSTHSTIDSDSNTYNIPPFPAFNFNGNNEHLQKCTSNTSLNTNSTNNSSHSIVNSKTIGTPGYNCHRRKLSSSRVVDMSLFIPPTEQELQQSRLHRPSLSISSTPEAMSLQGVPANEKLIGGSLDRNRYNASHQNNLTYGGVVCRSPNRDRSISASYASTSRDRSRHLSNTPVDYKTSPILRNASFGQSSRIQFKQVHRCDSGTEISNANHASIIPSSPNKRPYPPSIASSSSSTTLSSTLSLTHISQPNLNGMVSSQSSQSINGRAHDNHMINTYSPKPTSAVVRSPMSSISSITPIKPHSSFKITRSVTISEGGHHNEEIDIQPLEKEEIKVYQKGRFTITCEHSRRPSVNSIQDN